jgi:sulfoxide reductase heme-binding subunit YedZ
MSKNLYFRHTVAAFLAFVASVPFWYGRLDWDPEMRFWRAIGDGSFVLLAILLMLGPLARLLPSTSRFLPWRRELGIWFAILALVHTVVILDGWIRWDWMRFFGYEFLNQFGRHARVEPGFGLSNLIGIVAIVIALPLLITSSNWAVRRLGSSAWKWLHIGAYIIFYLVVIHSLYFLFMHYTVSFHRPVPEPNWFRYPFLTAAMMVLILQLTGFLVTVRKRADMKRAPSSEGPSHDGELV